MLLRTGMMNFIAGWWFWANMKVKPVSSSRRAVCSMPRSSLTPRASNISALPDLEVTERLPCLATKEPIEAQRIATVEEILKLPILSPPVPTMSINSGRSVSSTGSATALARMTDAAAASASTGIVSSSFIESRNARISSSFISWRKSRSKAAWASL